MKNKLFLTAALAATIGLLSCSKDNGGEQADKDSRSVFLKIEQETIAGRSIDDKAAAAQVTFSQGILYFTDATGVVKHIYTITSTATNVNDATPGTNVNITDLKAAAGVEIKKVDGSVRTAYMVGNENLISGYPTIVVGQNISVLTGHALTYASVTPISSTNLINATLYGSGNLVPRPSGTSKQFDVTIPVKPHIARIEIVDITGVDAADGTLLKEFDIQGVYVNAYYEQVAMNRAQVAGKFKHWGTGADDATHYSALNTDYPTYMRDLDATTYFGNTATTLKKIAKASDVNKVWAFNVFAPEGAGVEFPHIILSIKNVVTDPTPAAAGKAEYPVPSFVTVRSFTNDGLGAGTAGDKATLKAGVIYRIEPGYFKISPDNFTTPAELTEIDVLVKLDLLTWSIQGIKPVVD